VGSGAFREAAAHDFIEGGPASRLDPLSTTEAQSGKTELNEPLAGKSTLNRLESGEMQDRCKKIACRPDVPREQR
jgi:hypothetical protein